MQEDTFKVCTICKDPKSTKEFNKHKKNPDGLQTHCQTCSREKAKEYYKANKSKVKSDVRCRTKEYVEAAKAFIITYLSNKGCVDCAEKDPVVLEFDHVNGRKRQSISHMVGAGYSVDSIQKEIDKCEIRCANCHRRKTAKQFGYYRIIEE